MLHIEEGLMTSVNEAVIHYIAAWNERDPERRRDLVMRTWTEDGTYIDAHRQAVGHDGIDAMLARTQDQFLGYRIGLASGIEVNNDFIRFSWAAGGRSHRSNARTAPVRDRPSAGVDW